MPALDWLMPAFDSKVPEMIGATFIHPPRELRMLESVWSEHVRTCERTGAGAAASGTRHGGW